MCCGQPALSLQVSAYGSLFQIVDKRKQNKQGEKLLKHDNIEVLLSSTYPNAIKTSHFHVFSVVNSPICVIMALVPHFHQHVSFVCHVIQNITTWITQY